jgi:hypothetical protein
VDKTPLIRPDSAGNDIPQYQAGGKDDDLFTGQNIPANNPAHGYHSTAHIAFHPGLFPNYHPPFDIYITQDTAVYPGKSPGFNIAF